LDTASCKVPLTDLERSFSRTTTSTAVRGGTAVLFSTELNIRSYEGIPLRGHHRYGHDTTCRGCAVAKMSVGARCIVPTSSQSTKSPAAHACCTCGAAAGGVIVSAARRAPYEDEVASSTYNIKAAPPAAPHPVLRPEAVQPELLEQRSA
jgi:hypothetical protein